MTTVRYTSRSVESSTIRERSQAADQTDKLRRRLG